MCEVSERVVIRHRLATRLSARVSPWLGTDRTIRRLALASLVANTGIVVTGGAVRLTASGLGCPTVPACTEDSLVPTREMGVHGVIEFGNRQLTFVLGAIAAVCLLATLVRRPRRRPLVALAALVLAAIPAQALIGAVTVLTELNPWVVGCHFLVSMAAIAAAYTFWRRAAEPDGPGVTDRPGVTAVPPALRHLAAALAVVAAAVLVSGVVVTGAGPHAGDAAAKRNGLDLESVAQAHVDVVFLLLGLSIGAWFALRAASAVRAARAVAVLLAVELGQGAIGFVQYLTDLPVLLVGAHMLGACLVWLAVLDVLYRTRIRTPAPDAASDAGPAPAPESVVVSA